MKHCNLLQINPNLKNLFVEENITAYRTNKNRCGLLGSKRL